MKRIKICPICAVVSMAWILMTAGVLAGKLPFADYQVPIAILMGGTVVGIAYKKEKGRMFVIPAGFLLVYLALKYVNWVVFGIEVVVLGIVAYIYFVLPEKTTKAEDGHDKIREIEEKLKNCC